MTQVEPPKLLLQALEAFREVGEGNNGPSKLDAGLFFLPFSLLLPPSTLEGPILRLGERETTIPFSCPSVRTNEPTPLSGLPSLPPRFAIFRKSLSRGFDDGGGGGPLDSAPRSTPAALYILGSFLYYSADGAGRSVPATHGHTVCNGTTDCVDSAPTALSSPGELVPRDLRPGK